MKPSPEVEIIVIVRQPRGSCGTATRRGDVDLLATTPIADLLEQVLRPAFEEAAAAAGLLGGRRP